MHSTSLLREDGEDRGTRAFGTDKQDRLEPSVPNGEGSRQFRTQPPPPLPFPHIPENWGMCRKVVSG